MINFVWRIVLSNVVEEDNANLIAVVEIVPVMIVHKAFRIRLFSYDYVDNVIFKPVKFC